MSGRVRRVISKPSQPCLLLELKHAEHLNFRMVLIGITSEDTQRKEGIQPSGEALSVLDCKSKMVQGQWCTTGGDKCLTGQSRPGPTPHSLHLVCSGPTGSICRNKEAPWSGIISSGASWLWPQISALGVGVMAWGDAAPGVQGPGQTGSFCMHTSDKRAAVFVMGESMGPRAYVQILAFPSSVTLGKWLGLSMLQFPHL